MVNRQSFFSRLIILLILMFVFTSLCGCRKDTVKETTTDIGAAVGYVESEELMSIAQFIQLKENEKYIGKEFENSEQVSDDTVPELEHAEWEISATKTANNYYVVTYSLDSVENTKQWELILKKTELGYSFISGSRVN